MLVSTSCRFISHCNGKVKHTHTYTRETESIRHEWNDFSPVLSWAVDKNVCPHFKRMNEKNEPKLHKLLMIKFKTQFQLNIYIANFGSRISFFHWDIIQCFQYFLKLWPTKTVNVSLSMGKKTRNKNPWKFLLQRVSEIKNNETWNGRKTLKSKTKMPFKYAHLDRRKSKCEEEKKRANKKRAAAAITYE